MIIRFPWTSDRIAAIAAGIGAIAFLWWFFFGGRSRRPGTRATAAPAGEGDSVTIRIEGGYDPDTVIARRGVPLTIVFDRRESSPCSDEIVMPEFGIRQSLLANGRTNVRILPARTGEFPFACGMNMLHGKIQVVEP
ncbi:MAG: cupredoxin domain-containing protein [Acidobacteriota bacterium]